MWWNCSTRSCLCSFIVQLWYTWYFFSTILISYIISKHAKSCSCLVRWRFVSIKSIIWTPYDGNEMSHLDLNLTYKSVKACVIKIVHLWQCQHTSPEVVHQWSFCKVWPERSNTFPISLRQKKTEYISITHCSSLQQLFIVLETNMSLGHVLCCIWEMIPIYNEERSTVTVCK